MDTNPVSQDKKNRVPKSNRHALSEGIVKLHPISVEQKA